MLTRSKNYTYNPLTVVRFNPMASVPSTPLRKSGNYHHLRRKGRNGLAFTTCNRSAEILSRCAGILAQFELYGIAKAENFRQPYFYVKENDRHCAILVFEMRNDNTAKLIKARLARFRKEMHSRDNVDMFLWNYYIETPKCTF